MSEPASDTCRITLIGAATVLIECGSFRLLTDPVFDPPGTRYTLRVLGLIPVPMEKTGSPSVPPDQVGRLDAILLSHEGHADNLDHSGRGVLRRAPLVVTTPAAARRLGPPALGLETWAATTLTGQDGSALHITATPARHGPPGSLPIVGPVTGFLLEWPGQKHGGLYVSGDTVWHRALRQIGARYRVSAALLHLGGAAFPISGPLRYTMTARDVPRTARAVGARTILPIHYEGWAHFHESPARARQWLRNADMNGSLVWLEPGRPMTVTV